MRSISKAVLNIFVCVLAAAILISPSFLLSVAAPTGSPVYAADNTDQQAQTDASKTDSAPETTAAQTEAAPVYLATPIDALSADSFPDQPKPDKELPHGEKGRLLVLMYHDFASDAAGAESNPDFCTTGDKFISDIETLRGAGYIPLSLEEYSDGDYDAFLDYFIVTVDDGYLSNYEIAYPALRELNVHADIFINTDQTERENHFSYAQAAEMEESGLVKIYSHCTSHYNLREVGYDFFESETEKSFLTLDEKLGKDRKRFFSYPYGVYDEASCDHISAMGAELQLVQEKWDFDGDGYGLLLRYEVAYGTDMNALIAVIEADAAA